VAQWHFQSFGPTKTTNRTSGPTKSTSGPARNTNYFREPTKNTMDQPKIQQQQKDPPKYYSPYIIIMNTASKLGPHTQTDRGTCPGAGL
jgi:hypothetical protein